MRELNEKPCVFYYITNALEDPAAKHMQEKKMCSEQAMITCGRVDDMAGGGPDGEAAGGAAPAPAPLAPRAIRRALTRHRALIAETV